MLLESLETNVLLDLVLRTLILGRRTILQTKKMGSVKVVVQSLSHVTL